MIKKDSNQMQSFAEAVGRRGVLAILTFYRWVVSPILLTALGPACRFEPSCSAYAAATVSEYGVRRGGWMALLRIIRCRPGGGWGYDPPVASSCRSASNIGPR